MTPPLVHYTSVDEYREHYKRIYCQGSIQTFDGIRVHFSPERFRHVFFESTSRDGRKDAFSFVRAQRIDWIKATLGNLGAELFEGWDKQRRRYDARRRVAVIYENFVVVIKMSVKKNGKLKANFVTCYQADNSIGKIRNSPGWSREACMHALK
ncbi:MAG: hypothetical protein R6U27_08260 [Desulfobacterales bacterium]